MKKTLGIIGIIVILIASIWFGRQWYFKQLFNQTGKGVVTFTELSLEAAMAQAKTQNKPIFMDAYATWCGPCRKMATTTFKDPELANYFNATYISLRIDVDSEIGKQLSQKSGIAVLPTLLFISPDGKEIHRLEGFHSAEELLTVARNLKQ